MTTLVQRRRGVTYGKPHRRVVNSVEFHGATPLGSEREMDRPGTRQAESAPDSGLIQMAASDDSQHIKAPSAGKLGRGDNSNVRNHSIYEFTSSEDEISAEPSQTQPSPIAKKRKLAHSINVQVPLSASIANTTQAHIAPRSSRFQKPPGIAQKDNDRSAQVTRGAYVRHEGREHDKLPSAQKRRNSKPDKEDEERVVERFSQPRKPATTPGGSAVDRSVATKQHRARTASHQDGVPPPAQKSRGVESRSPVTPPRSSSPSSEACVTPRQKELWDRLLTPKCSSQSPSRPAISGLELDNVNEAMTRGVQSLHRQDSPKIHVDGTRSNRLIDSLSMFEHGSSSLLKTAERQGCNTGKNDYGDNTSSTSSEDTSAGESVEDSVTTDAPADHIKDIMAPPEHHHRSRYAPREAKVTYAQQRSYMTDHMPVRGDMLQAEFGILDQPSHKNASRSEQTVDDYDLLPEPDGQNNSMRSARELREAGGNVRLLSELEHVLDEIDGNSRNRIAQRSTLLRLTSRLLEPSTARLFVEKGLESRFLRSRIANDDEFITSLKAMCIVLLLDHGIGSTLMSQADKRLLRTFCVQLIPFSKDLKAEVEVLAPKISHENRRAFRKVCDHVLNLKSWQPGVPPGISSQMMGLQCLQQVSEWRRGNDDQALLSREDLTVIAQSVFSDETKSVQALPRHTYCLGLAISVVERSILDNHFQGGETIDDDLLSWLTKLLPQVRSLKKAPSSFESKTLHFYSNLTQMRPEVCNAFAQSTASLAMLEIVDEYFQSVIAPEPRQEHTDLSKVILALASLINIAAVSETMCRRTLLPTNGDRSILDTLIFFFLQMQSRATEVYSEDEINSNVAFGYLSVLISCLCLDSTTRAHAQQRLPDQSLEAVLDAVREFLRYHKAIDAMSSAEDHASDQSGFIERVQDVLKRLTM